MLITIILPNTVFMFCCYACSKTRAFHLFSCLPKHLLYLLTPVCPRESPSEVVLSLLLVSFTMINFLHFLCVLKEGKMLSTSHSQIHYFDRLPRNKVGTIVIFLCICSMCHSSIVWCSRKSHAKRKWHHNQNR